MTAITNYFEQAQLSLAAYALDLQQGMFGSENADYVAALRDGGMSQSQAEEFANTYTVIAQSPETGFLGNGFSATVFQNVESGELTVAIRGSEKDLNDWFGTNFGDIGSDGIAVSQGLRYSTGCSDWWAEVVTRSCSTSTTPAASIRSRTNTNRPS